MPIIASRTRIICLIILNLITAITSFTSHARDIEHPLRPGRGQRRGNEQSERVTQVTPGVPTFMGSGCPIGTSRIVFSPDNLSFSIIFDQFVAELNANSRTPRSLMSCDIILPIQIPPRMQMEITRVDFRGFVGLPGTSRAVLASMYNFRGPRGDMDRMNMRYTFNGPVMDNYEISSDVLNPHGRPVGSEVSPCGGTTTLRIVNQLRVQAERGQDAMATIDSIDGSAQSVYYINWRSCQPGRVRGR